MFWLWRIFSLFWKLSKFGFVPILYWNIILSTESNGIPWFKWLYNIYSMNRFDEEVYYSNLYFRLLMQYLINCERSSRGGEAPELGREILLTLYGKSNVSNNPAITLLTPYFSETIKDRNVKFWHNLHSSLVFVILKFEFDIFNSLETMRFSAT